MKKLRLRRPQASLLHFHFLLAVIGVFKHCTQTVTIDNKLGSQYAKHALIGVHVSHPSYLQVPVESEHCNCSHLTNKEIEI